MPDYLTLARHILTPRYTGVITEEMADCIREGRGETAADRPSYGHALAMEVLSLEAWEAAPAVRPQRFPLNT